MMRVKRWLIVSLFFASIGEWIYFIALNLRVLDLTGSAFAVSGLYLLIPLAMLVTNSWAGSVVDRVNIRTLLIVLNMLRATFVICIVFVTDVWMIYCLTFIMQMTASIYRTAEMVYITRLIPETEQQRFNGWRSIAESSGFVLGPTIAGGLFAIGSIEVAIAVNGVMLIILAILHMFLPNIRVVERTESLSLSTVVADWRIIMGYAWKHQFVTLIFVCNSLYIMTITSLDSLEAAFAIQTLALNEATYGLLVTVAGIGFVIGSIVTIQWLISPLKAMQYGMLFSACGYLIYGLSTSWWVAAIGFLFVSGSLPFVNVGFMTYMQQHVTAGVLGRFLSIMSLTEAMGVMSLTVIFGLLTYIVSIRYLIVIGVAIICIVFILLNILDWLRNKKNFYGKY